LIFSSSNGVFFILIVFVAYSVGSRILIANAHRRGIRFFRRGQYEQAIRAFEESYEFFTCHPWIDRFRSIILMSASAPSYREMALCNIAFCHTQIGNGERAKEVYRRTLDEFPDSGLAASAMRMLESVGRTNSGAQDPTPILAPKL
jgi:tetratricopeptide (TPR) repeat protein